MVHASDIFFAYVCPSMGVVMSALMYAAPVNDLNEALVIGKLGDLNPIPWAVMTGNCLVGTMPHFIFCHLLIQYLTLGEK